MYPSTETAKKERKKNTNQILKKKKKLIQTLDVSSAGKQFLRNSYKSMSPKIAQGSIKATGYTMNPSRILQSPISRGWKAFI